MAARIRRTVEPFTVIAIGPDNGIVDREDGLTEGDAHKLGRSWIKQMQAALPYSRHAKVMVMQGHSVVASFFMQA